MNKYVKIVSPLLALVILCCTGFCFDILINSAISNLGKPLSKVEIVAQYVGRFTIGYYLFHKYFEVIRNTLEDVEEYLEIVRKRNE